MSFSAEFTALSREAGIAAGLLGSGATALRKAHSVKHGLYNLAFFELSIGFERLLKLIFVVDHTIEHDGRFPSNKELRSFGHDLSKLIENARLIGEKYIEQRHRFAIPDDEITSRIIECLSDFSKRARYYDLDLLAGAAAAGDVDPLQAWTDRVGRPILAAHYSQKKRHADEARARAFGPVMDQVALVRHHREDGSLMSSVGEAMLHSAETAVIQKWGQFYVLRIIRGLADLLYQQEHTAHRAGVDSVPFLHEFFVKLLNDDNFLKSRKTWNLYDS